MERLNHLFVLTEVDIKAVGPGVFNGWKAQLLRELYAETASRFNAGTALAARGERLDGAKTALRNCSIRPGEAQIKRLHAPPIRCLLAQLPNRGAAAPADMIAAMEAGEPWRWKCMVINCAIVRKSPLSAKTMRACLPSGGGLRAGRFDHFGRAYHHHA